MEKDGTPKAPGRQRPQTWIYAAATVAGCAVGVATMLWLSDIGLGQRMVTSTTLGAAAFSVIRMFKDVVKNDNQA